MTADELLALGPDFHGELVRGRIIEMAPAGSDHGDIALTLGSLVHVFVREHKLGRTYAAETGFILALNPDTVRAPDVAFVSAARVDQLRAGSGFLNGPPDLAVEVLSPSNSAAEMLEKVSDYLKAGTKLVWIVNPTRRTITVHDVGKQDVDVLAETDTLTAEGVLPGFAVRVATIFE
ncbi:MAG TPA: Uma2 family endonuclease [Tepidisphaeraceae bacterium]